MNFYITSLFFAIPTFVALILVEAIAAKRKGVKINHSADVISSLSSGITNTIRDGVKFSFAIISYSWLVDHMTVYKLEPVWLAVVIAFVVEDFSGYWMHRLNHRVNIFWNRHIIHHSSEEFNLSCALRQSISNTIRFAAIFMIPAALLGIPTKIFAILGPLHLFMQFWYHTQLIGKLGLLEYILVTPSHHRVHHAINPEYIDRNYSQILIFWDKLFGTFQPELDDVKPVYGTLKPAQTWNPVIINFKVLCQLIKDAWHTERILDKLRIWFMPTGWRPADVKEKYPLQEVTNPEKQIKYKTENSVLLVANSWVQLNITIILMFHLFTIIPSFSATL
ncbi:MAG TPA: fatty acid hydroxylase family protein, partial [Candidatus Marinimicrobia bacterium]|nr:fatty acid hydroxylase family protein [Candidatus Neomarinimicrobiota bacterium]